jgi:molybdopterin molybdotransferase
VHEAGAIPANLGIACDNYGDLLKKLTAGLRADALVTAAGVSVGDRDFVREMLAELETNEIFWKVDMKPGKSMAFGKSCGKPVFSLPGNPVSAMITFEEMVRPALLKMMGHQKVLRPLVNAILREDIVNKSGRVFFSRVNSNE